MSGVEARRELGRIGDIVGKPRKLRGASAEAWQPCRPIGVCRGRAPSTRRLS